MSRRALFVLLGVACLAAADEAPSAVSAPPATARAIVSTRPGATRGERLVVYGADEQAANVAFGAAYAELDRIEKLISEWHAGSDIDRLNAAAGGAQVTLSVETFDLLRRGKAISDLSRGAFALTWAALASVWDFSLDGRPHKAPEVARVLEKQKLVGDAGLVLDEANLTARLSRAGMKVGPGGIVTGYALDRALAVLAEHGFANALAFADGDIVVRGQKGSEPWRVGLQDPRGEGYFAMLPLRDQAIGTSGDYEHFFEADGVRYHHILDPRTGFPARGCRAVSVVARDGATADALATAVFVLGPEEGMALIETQPDTEAVIIDESNQLVVSSGLRTALVTLRPPTR